MIPILRRVLMFAFGVGLLLMSLGAVRDGHISTSRSVIARQADPGTFWLGVVGYAALGGFMLYYVFRRKRGDDDPD